MPPTRETPRTLAQFHDLIAEAGTTDRGGALWRLAEPGRQLDANLVRLAPGAEVGEHVEGDLDVLLVVLAGGGELGGGRLGVGQHDSSGPERQSLTAGTAVWLPRRAQRSLHAGPDGLVYLTAHQRRPGLAIGGLPGLAVAAPVGPGILDARARNSNATPPNSAVSDSGGTAPCLLDRVCPACDRVSPEPTARYCGHCGTPLPARAG